MDQKIQGSVTLPVNSFLSPGSLSSAREEWVRLLACHVFGLNWPYESYFGPCRSLVPWFSAQPSSFWKAAARYSQVWLKECPQLSLSSILSLPSPLRPTAPLL